MAAQRKMSLNKLYEETSSSLLRGHSAEMRFRKRAAEGNRKKGLAILDQLDKHFVVNQKWSKMTFRTQRKSCILKRPPFCQPNAPPDA